MEKKDATCFSAFLEELQLPSNSRDPRSIRLSSVSSVIVDVIRREEVEVSPGRMYARAVATLDGTLHQQHQDTSSLADSMSTQCSLLRLIRLTLPYMDTGTIYATATGTTRIIRGLLTATQSLEDVGGGRLALDASDSVGSSISSVFFEICEVSAQLINGYLSNPKSAHTMEQVICSFFQKCLLALVHNKRPTVRKIAVEEILCLLETASREKFAILSTVTNKHVLDKLEQSVGEGSIPKYEDLMETLQFLQAGIMRLDFVRIGERIMRVLVTMFGKATTMYAKDGVPLQKLNDATDVLSLINGLLSTLFVVFEEYDSDSVDLFAARVLATLLQSNPTLIFRGAEIGTMHSGRLVYGQVALSTVQRVLNRDPEKGCKLLPLTIAQVLKLSCYDDDPEQVSVAQSLSAELSQILRMDLNSVRTKDPRRHQECCNACLTAMKSVLVSPFKPGWNNFLTSLALLMVQIDPAEGSVKLCIEGIIRLRQELEPDSTFRYSLDEALSSIVQGFGIEVFWEQVDFTTRCKSDPSSDSCTWLLKTMRVSGSFASNAGSQLSFFQDRVLPLARHFDDMSVDSVTKSLPLQNRVIEIWGLFPCFCANPCDVAVALPRFGQVLIRAMRDTRYPQLMAIIASGLELLATGIYERHAQITELATDEPFVEHRSEMKATKTLADKFLPSLFKIVDGIYGSRGESEQMDTGSYDAFLNGDPVSSQAEALSKAIASLARLASPSILQNLFTRVLQRLLESSQASEDLSNKMCSLLSLSHSLVLSESLDQASVVLLYRSLKPLIRTDETRPRVQKRAYKLLAELCNSEVFVLSDGRLNELVELLTSTTATSQISARLMRIKCLQKISTVLGQVGTAEEWVVASLLGETLLCLKDSNRRTREAAFKLLLSIGEVRGDNAALIRTITAALASETSHMRSAAVMALSKVLHEYAKVDPEVQELLSSMLKTVLLLSDDPSREVIKSVVGFVRIFVAACPRDKLEPLVNETLKALLKYHRGKDRFRAKIKIIVKKLVRLYGYDFLFPLVPKGDDRLLLHMRRLSEREARRKKGKGNRPKTQNGTATFDDMLASDEEDSDDGMTAHSSGARPHPDKSITKLGKRSGPGSIGGEMSKRAEKSTFPSVSVRIRNDMEGDDFEMQDLTKRAVQFNEESDESDSEHGISFDESGKLVVTEKYSDTISVEGNRPGFVAAARMSSLTDDLPRKPHKKQSKPGANYKSKKAGGDVKRKGQKYDPYAYVPLDGRSYTKKNRRQAVEQLDTIIGRSSKRRKR